jgi:hypothetical protein
MVVPSAKSQSNWRKVDRNANNRPIQGEFRICYRVRTASWPWGWQDRRLRGRRGVLLYRESCKVHSLPKSPADLLTFYSGVNRKVTWMLEWPIWSADVLGALPLRNEHRREEVPLMPLAA